MCGKRIFLTLYGTRAVGTGIVVQCHETVHHTFKDPEGRFIGIIGDHEEGKFLFLSFYAPSVAREILDFVINSCKTKRNNNNANLCYCPYGVTFR